MTNAPKPTIPDLVSLGIQALAKIAQMPVHEGVPGNAFQELLDRDAVVKQIHVLRDALMGISAEHGRQLTQRSAQDESLAVALTALMAIRDHNLPDNDGPREFNAEGDQVRMGVAFDAVATMKTMLAAANQPRSPFPFPTNISTPKR